MIVTNVAQAYFVLIMTIYKKDFTPDEVLNVIDNFEKDTAVSLDGMD